MVKLLLKKLWKPVTDTFINLIIGYLYYLYNFDYIYYFKFNK